MYFGHVHQCHVSLCWFSQSLSQHNCYATEHWYDLLIHLITVLLLYICQSYLHGWTFLLVNVAVFSMILLYDLDFVLFFGGHEASAIIRNPLCTVAHPVWNMSLNIVLRNQLTDYQCMKLCNLAVKFRNHGDV